jgi:putative copper resistance protein D
MTETISLWIHVIAVSVWVGPQFFMFIVAIPALRTVEDARVRAQLMRTIVTRFGWMAWGAMAVIIASGIGNLLVVSDEAWFDLWDSDYRWWRIFIEKMTLVALAITLTAVHTLFVGPRQLRLAEQMDADPEETRKLRRASIGLSSLALLASIGAVYMGVLLADHDYSFIVR